jgi:hypothetical protein
VAGACGAAAAAGKAAQHPPRHAQENKLRQRGKGGGSKGPAAAAAGAGSSEGEGEASPFSGISATCGWETFHLVHRCWISQLDVPDRCALRVPWPWPAAGGWRLVAGRARPPWSWPLQ